MTVKYSLINDGDSASITVYADGKVLTATDGHKNFNEIVRQVTVDGEVDADLFDIAQTIAKRFERLSERVTFAGGHIYFDGDEQHGVLVDTILRLMEEGNDFQPLVNFMEKVQQNPNDHSREQLYTWATKHGLTVAPDGDLIAYKGVGRNDDNEFVSSTAGPGIVDGVRYDNDHLPNHIGAVVEMPRSNVQHDPRVGCASGLHVANWRYARSWSTDTLKVKVNPRDVVSVPTESNDEKMRVCRYVVVEATSSPVTTVVDKTVKTEKPATDKVDWNKVPLKRLRQEAQARTIRVQGRRPSHCTKPELVKALKADDRRKARQKSK
jgi:hypothetical protein